VNLHPLLAELFARWNGSGVVWAFLRVPANMESPEGDLDLLVDPARANDAFAAARALGFVAVPGYAPDTHLLHFHRGTMRWLWLHCTSDLAFGPYGAVRPEGTTPLADRRAAGPIFRLLENDEFWITLLHALVDQGRVSQASEQRLAATVGAVTDSGPLPEAFASVLPAGWTPDRVVAAVRSGDWDTLRSIIPAVRARALERARRPPTPVRWTTGAWRRLRAGRLARHGTGVRVALIGPDGAGKSTLAAGLQETFPFPVERVYMGLTGGWLRQVDRLRVPGIVRFGRLSVIWGRYARGLYHAHRGRLVVFDRYTYDGAVPPGYRMTPLRRVGRWIDAHSCPAPDLVLILDAPGEVMYQRKGAYDPGILEDWRRRFREVERRVRHVAVLDTSRPADQVRADATAHIWARYVERWSRL
jgi:thymidylate kinase